MVSIFFITSRHRGGGHKRLYRLIDFKRVNFGSKAKVSSIEYDPNRNCRIALLSYINGGKSYILCPFSLGIGDVVVSDFNAEIKVGNAVPLSRVPSGIFFHNLEFQLY